MRDARDLKDELSERHDERRELEAENARLREERDALRAAIPGAFRRGVEYRETTNAPVPDDHGIRVRVGYACGAVVLDPPVVSTRVPTPRAEK